MRRSTSTVDARARTVTVLRGLNNSFGLVLQGGFETGGLPKAEAKAGTQVAFAEAGQSITGSDIITSVNGQGVIGGSHDHLVKLVKASKKTLTLGLLGDSNLNTYAELLKRSRELGHNAEAELLCRVAEPALSKLVELTVPWTTRPIVATEQHTQEFHFVDRARFVRATQPAGPQLAAELCDWAEGPDGHLYGFPVLGKKELAEHQAKAVNPTLEADSQAGEAQELKAYRYPALEAAGLVRRDPKLEQAVARPLSSFGATVTPTATPRQQAPKKVTMDGPDVCIVVAKANYTAVKPDQLGFTAGSKLQIISAAGNWWLVRDDTGLEGKAPSNYLEVVKPAAKVQAIAAYTAARGDQLGFEHGELLDVLSMRNQWWMVRNRGGKMGKAPSNYLQRVDQREREPELEPEPKEPEPEAEAKTVAEPQARAAADDAASDKEDLGGDHVPAPSLADELALKLAVQAHGSDDDADDDADDVKLDEGPGSDLGLDDAACAQTGGRARTSPGDPTGARPDSQRFSKSFSPNTLALGILEQTEAAEEDELARLEQELNALETEPASPPQQSQQDVAAEPGPGPEPEPEPELAGPVLPTASLESEHISDWMSPVKRRLAEKQGKAVPGAAAGPSAAGPSEVKQRLIARREKRASVAAANRETIRFDDGTSEPSPPPGIDDSFEAFAAEAAQGQSSPVAPAAEPMRERSGSTRSRSDSIRIKVPPPPTSSPPTGPPPPTARTATDTTQPGSQFGSFGFAKSASSNQEVPAHSVSELVLERPDLQTSYGFGFGTDQTGAKIVSQVIPGGLAEGKLETADRILSVNGINASTMQHKEVLDLLVSSMQVALIIERAVLKDPAAREIRRRSSISSVEPETSIVARWDNVGAAGSGPAPLQVRLDRPSMQDSYGFKFGCAQDGSVIVERVKPGGPASDRLFPGDELAAIDGVRTRGLSQADVRERVTSACSVTLDVVRSGGAVSAPEPTVPEGEPLEAQASPIFPAGETQREGALRYVITLERPDLVTSYGFKVGTTREGEVMVDHVLPGGVADGYLEPGDYIVSIDGVAVSQLSHKEMIAVITAETSIALGIERKPCDIGRDLEGATSQTMVVTVTRPKLKSSYGFGFGTDKSNVKHISRVSVGGASDGLLSVGDVILRIDDADISALGHDEVLKMLTSRLEVRLQIERQSSALAGAAGTPSRMGSISQVVPGQKFVKRRDSIGRPITLFEPLIEEEEPKSAPPTTAATRLSRPVGLSEEVNLTLTRQSLQSSYGFGFGTDRDALKLVSEVTPGGLCDGLLCPGDQILEINGTDATALEHADVLQVLKSNLSVNLKLDRRGGAVRCARQQCPVGCGCRDL